MLVPHDTMAGDKWDKMVHVQNDFTLHGVRTYQSLCASLSVACFTRYLETLNVVHPIVVVDVLRVAKHRKEVEVRVEIWKTARYYSTV